MTMLSRSLIHALCLAGLMMLFPSFARSQETTEATSTLKPEMQGEQPVNQGRNTPAEAEQKKTAPAPQTVQGGAGEVIVPDQGKTVGEPVKTTATEESGKYLIRQGDTLWDIANNFLRDPFLWPILWKANPSITNPDLIYPGGRLTIPSLAPVERAMAAQASAEKTTVEKEVAAKEPSEAALSEEELSEGPATPPVRRGRAQPTAAEAVGTQGSLLVLPEEAPVPVMDKYSMLNAGFVNDVETGDMIVASEEHKSIMGYDDIVYVDIHARETTNIGDKFLIYQQLKKINHPITGQEYGRLVKVLGILKIIAKDSPDTLTGRISLSFDAIEKGSLLTPYQEPVLVYDESRKKTRDLSGYILEVVDSRSLNSQLDIVYLDKGSVDGVEPGDRFIVYTDPSMPTFPRKVIGELQVFLVKDRTSTAVVRKSIDSMAKGDKIEFKK